MTTFSGCSGAVSVAVPNLKCLFPDGLWWFAFDSKWYVGEEMRNESYTHKSTGLSFDREMIDAVLNPYGFERTYVPSFVWAADYKEPVVTDTTTKRADSSSSLRLRPRSRVTRDLEVVGKRVRGWWKDLPVDSDAQLALLWMQEYSVDGTKLGMARQVTTKSDEGEVGSISLVEVFFRSEERPSGSGLWVCPELVAELFNVRCFRGLDTSLLSSLRSRARLWAKERGVSAMDLSLFLPGTLVFSSLPQKNEVESLGALRSTAAVWSIDVLGALSQGVLKAPTGPTGVWATLKTVFGGNRDSILEPQGTRLVLAKP